jgi:LPXTG-motif cell wall-anchored protein
METITEELSFEPCEVPPGKGEEKKPVKDVDFKNVNALPKTGAGANLAAALVGLVLVGGGVGLVLYSRRRRLPGAPTGGAGS